MKATKCTNSTPHLSTISYPTFASCSSMCRLLHTYAPLPLHLTHKAAPSPVRPFYIPRLGTNLCILYSYISTPSPTQLSLSFFYTPAPVAPARSSLFYPTLSTFGLFSPALPHTPLLYHYSASPQFCALLLYPLSLPLLFFYRRVAPRFLWVWSFSAPCGTGVLGATISSRIWRKL